ncbi:MAG TPA: hypothetical protein VFO19_04875, partial [Vicinamibacterales bacterium]|nr:hypothetical protein [Vicinamibacterales bacterium]
MSWSALVIAWACPVCFRVEDGATADGVRAAVIVLMSVTLAVLSGFAAFIARWYRGTEPFS